MALTVTRQKPEVHRIQGVDGGSDAIKVFRMVAITFDASYATGGEALTADDLGLSSIDFVSVEPASGYLFEYDYTNAKVLAYRCAAAAGAHTQVPNATNLSAVSTRALVVGSR